MRCPKCGYNSFDHLDSCKKCSKDLTEHKAKFNIQSVLLAEMPTEVATAASEETAPAAFAEPGLDDFAADTSSEETDDFGFDFMGDSDEDENLAFDELFEEVSSEDDIEETLPAPEGEAVEEETELAGASDLGLEPENIAAPAEETSIDDFSFDEVEPEAATEEASEFGFDADDDPAADIFAETEEDFSIDGIDFEEPKDK